MAKKEKETPLMEQYKQFSEMKQKHPDAIILLRVGDFYECIGKDAVTASEILGTTLTRRANGKAGHIELTGFPHHALDTYLPKLVRAGHRLAICEQLEDPKLKQRDGMQFKPVEIITTQQKSEVNSEQNDKVHREPQFVTVNGDKITHGHIFQHAEKEAWLFSVRVNGKQLPTVQLSAEESQRFSNLSHENRTADAVRELMEKYYPSKLERHLSKEEFTNGVTLSDGRKIDKFNVYKENNPDMKGYGKWHFYVDVGGVKMSQVGDRDSLNAYFDKSRTPAQITENLFGEKLHLASAYKSYVLPDGVKDIRIAKGDGKQWCISAEIDGVRTPKRNLSYDDGASFFSTHTATKEQLAAKYLTKDINEIRNQREHVSNSMKI